MSTTATATATAVPLEEQPKHQETKCRDPIFAILFYGNVAAIAAVAGIYGPDALSSTTTTNSNGTSSTTDYSGYVIATVIIAMFSFLASAGGVAMLMCIPETMIKIALLFTVVMAGVWMVLAFLSGSIFGGIIGVVFFALTLCYARAVWSRIPFASINLITACTAIKANLGVVLFAYIFTVAAAGWSILWSVAFAGVFDKTYVCNDTTGVCDSVNYGYLFLLFVAFFFGHQVIQNCVHVTTAGTYGKRRTSRYRWNGSTHVTDTYTHIHLQERWGAGGFPPTTMAAVPAPWSTRLFAPLPPRLAPFALVVSLSRLSKP